MSSHAAHMEEVSAPPAVGLNWLRLSQRLNVDLEHLQREGCIVVAGEYYPEAGYSFDPVSLDAHSVTAGDIAFHHSYFLGELAIRNFRSRIEPLDVVPPDGQPVIPRVPVGPLIALFNDDVAVARSRQRILEASIGSGISAQKGPLGPELRVEQTTLPGRVATVMAGHGGAVLSIGGIPVDTMHAQAEATAEADRIASDEVDDTNVMRAPYGETGL